LLLLFKNDIIKTEPWGKGGFSLLSLKNKRAQTPKGGDRDGKEKNRAQCLSSVYLKKLF